MGTPVSWFAVDMESDDELRARLRYVGAWPVEAVETCTGEALEDLAWRFGLKRRRR